MRGRSIGILLIYLIFFGRSTYGQDELNELTVDRPGIAEMPFTVAPGMFQLEMGIDYFSRYNGDLYNIPTALFRTGISNSAEVRITTRHLLDYTEGKNFTGLAPLSVGVKVHIIHQQEWIPETDILTDLHIPVSNDDSQPSRLGHDVFLLFQNDFYPHSAINYNIGLIWDGLREDPVFSGSFCYNYLPSRRVGLFIEYFTYEHTAIPWEHGADGGMTYLLTPHLQADFSAGISNSKLGTNFFLSTGISIRFQKAHLRSKQNLLGSAMSRALSSEAI